jgi:hypothetical protein
VVAEQQKGIRRRASGFKPIIPKISNLRGLLLASTNLTCEFRCCNSWLIMFYHSGVHDKEECTELQLKSLRHDTVRTYRWFLQRSK